MANKRVPGHLPVSNRSLLSARLTVAGVALMLGLSACNSSALPLSENFPTVDQKIIESAADWQMIAGDVWNEVNASLEAGGYHETAIGLESPAQKTQFTQGMDEFLFTQAVNHGVAVTPDAPFTLTYSVQILHYAPPPGSPAASNVPDNDGWVSNDSTSEMILTISVTDGTSVRIRQSKVYYIDDAETAMYEASKSSTGVPDVSESPLVSSNWYSDNPHSVEPAAMHEANQFALMIDPKHGPIRSIDKASTVAAAHCGKVGKSEARYVDESYPTNDRSQIRVEYECM